MPITPLPTPPSRNDPTNFSARGDAFLGALPTFATEANALAVDVNADAVSADADATTATTKAQEAEASALAAAAVSGAVQWVSGTTYAVGVVVWSPITYLSYRRRTAGGGTTDPSLDETNWALLIPTPVEIRTPTNVSPAPGATNIGGTPTLTASAFLSLYGLTMTAAQWQVSTVSNFSTTVLNTGDVAGSSTSYNVPNGILAVNTSYFWRVRYKDANGVYSQFSTATSFTTSASFIPTVPGEPFGGGFFAGRVIQGGITYLIIVAPKSTGENSSRQFKTTNDASPVNTQTLNNGFASSASMNNAQHPAAQFCEGLTIGGFSDWYLPSRDELELCYRNFKPTTAANNVSARSLSAYTYPEGNDVSGDTMGRNRNSNPLGAVYTSGNPAQTTVTAFITGGTEAFAADLYWSSSEFSATIAWLQVFSNGLQFDASKSDGGFARAVRRLAI